MAASLYTWGYETEETRAIREAYNRRSGADAASTVDAPPKVMLPTSAGELQLELGMINSALLPRTDEVERPNDRPASTYTVVRKYTRSSFEPSRGLRNSSILSNLSGSLSGSSSRNSLRGSSGRAPMFSRLSSRSLGGGSNRASMASVDPTPPTASPTSPQASDQLESDVPAASSNASTTPLTAQPLNGLRENRPLRYVSYDESEPPAITAEVNRSRLHVARTGLHGSRRSAQTLPWPQPRLRVPPHRPPRPRLHCMTRPSPLVLLPDLLAPAAATSLPRSCLLNHRNARGVCLRAPQEAKARATRTALLIEDAHRHEYLRSSKSVQTFDNIGLTA